MRCMLKAVMPVETANGAAREGKLGTTIESIVAELKPEAAYFIADEGRRTALIFFDLPDSSKLPSVAEPWFLAFNAEVTVVPAMDASDLSKAAGDIEKSAKKFHQTR
jgi:hypothetical protein